MHQIPPHKLWIGSIGDLQDLHRLYDVGINAVVQLAYEEAIMPLPRDLILCRFPLLDGEDNAVETLGLAITTLTQLLKQEFATLVCCQAGLSRSPAVAAAALTRINGDEIVVNVARIAACRPTAIHPGLFAQVLASSASKP